jgi:hypothetical protein
MWDGTHCAAMKRKSPGAAFIALGAAFVAIGASNQRGLLPLGIVFLAIGLGLMMREKRSRPKQ